MAYIISALFLLIPAAAAAYFGVSLFRFLQARSKNKKQPGSYAERQLKERKIHLIVSSVIFGTLLTVVVSFWLLLLTAIAFM
ncbi:MAG: hypothetical protein GX628_11185 [Clostridiales bacterium]|nr:hypothetical protein [Clostridiales bacterium]